MHLQTHRRISGKGGGQVGKGHGKGLPGVQIRDGSGVFGNKAFRRVGQHVKARFGNEPRGQSREQIAVENRNVGPHPTVHQGVLHSVMGQNGKIRHL